MGVEGGAVGFCTAQHGGAPTPAKGPCQGARESVVPTRPCTASHPPARSFVPGQTTQAWTKACSENPACSLSGTARAAQLKFLFLLAFPGWALGVGASKGLHHQGLSQPATGTGELEPEGRGCPSRRHWGGKCPLLERQCNWPKWPAAVPIRPFPGASNSLLE